MANAMDGTRELARRCYFTFQAISLATFSVFIFENFNFLKTKWNVFFCRFQLLTFSFHAALSPCLPLFFGLSVFASRRLQLRPYRTLQPTLQFKDMEKLDLLFARVFDCNFDSPIVRLGLCVVLFHVIVRFGFGSAVDVKTMDSSGKLVSSEFSEPTRWKVLEDVNDTP